MILKQELELELEQTLRDEGLETIEEIDDVQNVSNLKMSEQALALRSGVTNRTARNRHTNTR
jgi:hypothetical protein